VAPSADKAKLTMRYYIEHLGDDPIFHSQLEKSTRLERLRQEESKERIILRNGGGIFVLSAQQRNATKSIEAAMGEGADIVILDESCLVQDDTEATIFRMIAGKGPDAFYCKIGNPFYIDPPNSHFFNTWNDPRYLKIFIDYAQGLKEGRYTEEFIDEARTKPLFDILFGCEFPSPDVMDEKGYRPLVLSDHLKYGVTPAIIKEAMQKAKLLAAERGIPFIRPKLGGDIGGGGDLNVFTLRWHKMAAVVGTNQSKDTMINVSEAERFMEEYGVEAEDVNIDDIGIGRGVTDRLIEKGHAVNGVSVGEPSFEPETYSNLKSELYWKLGLWMKDPDIRLDERPEWHQLTWIKYKVNSERQVKIEPKEDLKKRTKKSPDYAESLMLTFYEKSFLGFA